MVENMTLAILKDAVIQYGDYLSGCRVVEVTGATDDNRIDVSVTILPHMGFSEWFAKCYTSSVSKTTDT